jgi:hypothetical protein
MSPNNTEEVPMPAPVPMNVLNKPVLTMQWIELMELQTAAIVASVDCPRS